MVVKTGFDAGKMIGYYEEPYELKGSRTVLQGAGGKIPCLPGCTFVALCQQLFLLQHSFTDILNRRTAKA